MNLSFLRILLYATLLPLTASAADKDPYSMFPQPSENQQRYIIEVPKQDNEANYRLQLFIGKEQVVDCNRHLLFGKIERRELKGWGYHYYVVSDLRNGAQTLMQCPQPPQKRFVSMQSDLLRYNSRLGTVIYIPKGYEVRYRIWKTQETLQPAQVH